MTEFVEMAPSQPDIGYHHIDFINRHSTLNKLLTITAYLKHFARNLRAFLEHRQTGPVSAEELLLARLKWIKDTQEIANLNQIANHPNTSRSALVREL